MPPTNRAYRLAATGLLGLALLAGCTSRTPDQVAKDSEQARSAKQPDPCAIAVIDLDRVALGIGAVDKIRDSLGQFEEKCVAELRQATATLFGDHTPSGTDLADFDESTAPLVANLTADQQRQFARSLRTTQAQMLAREKKLRDDFLNEVRPYAYQIARQQGCQLVLTIDQVYVAAEQVDITLQVIRKICEINAAAPSSDSNASAESIRPTPRLASGGSFKMD